MNNCERYHWQLLSRSCPRKYLLIAAAALLIGVLEFRWISPRRRTFSIARIRCLETRPDGARRPNLGIR